MIVELVSVGTEILLGNIVNTNAKYLAEECALLGCSQFYQTVVGDNEKRLEAVLKTALERSDIVITTGGLGPTKDDLTKEVTASVLGLKLVEDTNTVHRINALFAGLDIKEIPQSNYKQAMVMENCIVLDNDNGTAPGMIAEKDGKAIILLPGPPNEMIPLFNEKVKPYLKSKSNEVIYSVMVKLSGIGESSAAEIIDDLIESQTNPTIAPYAKTSEVHLRITAKAKDEETAKAMTLPLLDEVKKRLGQYIYTIDEGETLEQALIKVLKELNLTLSTAESCTGGLLSGRIINVSGASEVFKEGFVTYSNEAKEKTLNVPHEILSEYGAVSSQTAEAMAKSCALAAGTDVGIATTGIAGPDGGTIEKPVGLVYIACYYKGKTTVEKYNFKGNRAKIREVAVAKAIDLARRAVKSEKQ